jgi:hypothetical protein
MIKGLANIFSRPFFLGGRGCKLREKRMEEGCSSRKEIIEVLCKSYASRREYKEKTTCR